MAASQSLVVTGGKSWDRSSGTALAFLHHFDQIAESHLVGSLGVDEEDRGSARAFAGCGIEHLEAIGLHVIEGFADVGHAERDVRETSASTVLLELFRHRGIGV